MAGHREKRELTLLVWGFFRNPFIHESAAALVSLHATKKGAWTAMRQAMLSDAMEEREFAIRFSGRWAMRRKSLQDKWYGIEAIAVRE